MHKCKCRCELYSNPIPKTTPHKKLSAGLDLKEKKIILYDLEALFLMETKKCVH